MEDQQIEVGDAVIYADTHGTDHAALVTAVWGAPAGGSCPMLNLTFVSSDESRTDTYGRQILREGSVSHASDAGAHGRYWRFAEEEKRAYHAPSQI